jgi:hypothetical protein
LEAGRVTPAMICDHVHEHHGDWNAFWLGELQSLCRDCHGYKSRGYQPDIGIDGFPVDPRHPVYRQRPGG